MNKRITKFATISLLGVASAASIVLLNQNILKVNKNDYLLQNGNIKLRNNKDVSGISLDLKTNDITSLYKNEKPNYNDKLWRNLISSDFKFNVIQKSWFSNVSQLEKFHNTLSNSQVKEYWRYKDNKVTSGKKTYFYAIGPESSITNQTYQKLDVNWDQYKKTKIIELSESVDNANKAIKNFNAFTNKQDNSIKLARADFSYYFAGSPYPYPKTSTDYIEINSTQSLDLVYEKISDNEYSVSTSKPSLKAKDYIDTKTSDTRIYYEIESEVYDANTGQKIGETPLIVKNNKETLDLSEFFVISPEYIENNDSYYLNNEPKIKFDFNLPLINALEQYKEIPKRFNNIYNLASTFYNKMENEQYLINLLFGSTTKAYKFLNSWLVNLANNFYSSTQIKAIETFLNDFINSDNKKEFKSIIEQLKIKDVEYKNIIVPSAKIKKEIETPYQEIIKNKINSLRYIVYDNTLESKLWIDSSLKNYESDTYQWNVWTDLALKNILNIDVFIDYVDSFGNKYTDKKIYDGQTKTFNNDLINVSPASQDSHPYSTTKITKIKFGGLNTSNNDLPTDSTINSSYEFEKFVKQSKQYATYNNQLWSTYDYDNSLKSLSSSGDGIEIKFRYIAEEKPVEESAWWEIKGEEQVAPFMLIPDEAWDDNIIFSNPDSPLNEILETEEYKTLVAGTLSRPFVMKKSITTEDLREATRKYHYANNEILKFTKDNISNLFLNYTFTNKYNELSNKPWWTWTFKELVQEETNYNNGVSGSFNVVQDNPYQDQWFKNFVSNPNLANKTMNDFFPKYNEGRFFVIGSYKPSIDSTQVKLTEEAGFYYAGEQKDAYNMITNFNYVVELEVKNKTYTSKLNELNIASNDYKGQNLSFRKYQQLMNSLTKEWVNYFAIDNSRFKEGQIKDPNIEYIYVPSDDPFIQTTYGYIKIDYQNSIPAVNQIGNDVVYEQLPFDLNKIIGFTEFRHKYNKYIIESKEEWDKLSKFEQSKVILIDSQNNEILIGGHVIAQEQNFKVQGAPRIIIPDEYVDPSLKDNPFFGFNQKTKEYISLEDLRNKWNSYSQEELFNILFGNYNYNNQAELLKERIKQFGVTLYVRIDDQYRLYWGYYWYEDGEKLGDETFDYVQLTKIEVVRTDLIDLSKFNYGYNRDKDTIVSFSSLVSNIKNIEKFAQFFNLDEFQLNNFVNGIKKIEILEQNQENGLIKIQITLNENYVLYNENDSFIITINTKELIKFELGSLSLNNFSQEIKEELSKRNNEEKIQYLNSLNLETKISLFKNQENKSIIFNSFISLFNDNQIQDIIFSLKNNDLIADIKFNDPNLVLDAKTNTTLTNFDHNLKVDLGLIDPHQKTKTIWLTIGIITGVGLLVITAIWLIIRRQRNKKQYYGASDKVLVNNIDNNQTDIDENKNLIENNNIDSENIN